MRIEEINITVQWVKNWDMAQQESCSLCDWLWLPPVWVHLFFLHPLVSPGAPTVSMAVDYGLPGSCAALKSLCNTDATISDPLKAYCSGGISLQWLRNQMISFFEVFCVTSSYAQTRCIFLFIVLLLKKQKISE